jgi:hypothetical protein
MAANRAAQITLFAVLMAQPVIAAIATQLTMPAALFVMAALTMGLGAATFLGLFYFHFYVKDAGDGR